MEEYGPYYRSGAPGGPGCRVAAIPVRAKASGTDQEINGSLLDGGPEASEVELLRTVASSLGIGWGKDEMGWWAMVPNDMRCNLTSSAKSVSELPFALYREDDNGARFLIDRFATRGEAEAKATELGIGGHKQYYYVDEVGDDGRHQQGDS